MAPKTVSVYEVGYTRYEPDLDSSFDGFSPSAGGPKKEVYHFVTYAMGTKPDIRKHYQSDRRLHGEMVLKKQRLSIELIGVTKKDGLRQLEQLLEEGI